MQHNVSIRYPRAYLSPFTTNQVHFRNPYVVALWSVLNPGLGNLLQDRKLKGLVLIVWAALVNTEAHLNQGLWYSCTGQFSLARDTVNTRWMLLYIAVWVYAAWDAYRGTVDLNRLYILADREDAPVTPMVVRALDVNYLDKRSPWLAAAWSAFMPGLGNLFLHKIIRGLFFVAWTIFILYLSHGLQAVHDTFTGNFQAAKSVLNLQWLLFMPGIYGFQIYDSYVSTVEYNKLFAKEQSRWLRQHYQSSRFKLPV